MAIIYTVEISAGTPPKTYGIKTDGKEVEIQKDGNTSIKYSLADLYYLKEIYRPGILTIKLLVNETSTTIDKISEVFKGCHVSLKAEDGDTTHTIASNYSVFHIQLEKEVIASTSLYVILEAYSPDKFLTLDKYSKAYTGKKLIGDIITNSKNWPDSDIQFPADRNKLSEIFNINANYIKPADKEEYIQPYLVQYNESFYDFLVRVTNRCGEFLFYEGDKINIGISPSKNSKGETDSISITKYISVRFNSQENTTAWKSDSVTDLNNKYTDTDTTYGNSSGIVKTENAELASYENLAPIPPKDKYSSATDFAPLKKTFLTSVSEAFSQTTLSDFILNVSEKTAKTITKSNLNTVTANSKYEETYATDDNKGKNNEIYLYSTVEENTDGTPVIFSQDFYKNIQEGISKAESRRIHVQVEDHLYKILLGSIIKIPGYAETYIVVKIEGSIKNGKRVQKIEAIPYDPDKIYPPASPAGPIRYSNPQRGVIVENADPLRINRVRIRYPWQNNNDDPSPYIRLSVPMASDGSGFNFLPEKGDEAIINYENGNIEKPYVEGLLYTNRKKPAGTISGRNTRSISSVNGHSIIFSDTPGNSDLAANFLPIWNTLNGFMPYTTFSTEQTTQASSGMGGIELTDRYGLYSISMSSDKRKISINSPYGKVDMNAFTGITLSAPNGDIKIVGKNIEITAGNNLTINSGKNQDLLKDIGNSIKKELLNKITVVDLSAVRTLLEVFLRPVAGTLRIKSNRYLCIEAGEGEAKIREEREQPLVGGGNDPNKIFIPEIPRLITSIIAETRALFRTCRSNTLTVLNNMQQYTAYKTIIERYSAVRYNVETIKTAEEVFNDSANNIEPVELEIKEVPVPPDDGGQATTTTTTTTTPVSADSDLQRNLTEINSLAEEIYLLVQSAGDLDTLYGTCSSLNDGKFVDAATKNKIKEICRSVFMKDVVEEQATAIQVQSQTIAKSDFREVIHSVLKEACNKQKNISDNNSQCCYNTIENAATDINDFDDDEEWFKYISQIGTDENNKQNMFINSYTSKFTGFSKDEIAWKNTDGGKILFSDKKGVTSKMENNAIVDYRIRQTDVSDVVSELKRILEDI